MSGTVAPRSTPSTAARNERAPGERKRLCGVFSSAILPQFLRMFCDGAVRAVVVDCRIRGAAHSAREAPRDGFGRGAVAVLPKHLRSGFKMSHILRLCATARKLDFRRFFGGRGVLRGAVCARRAISGGLLVPSWNPFGRDGKGGIEIKTTQSGFCPVCAERISVDTPRGVVVIFYGSAYARP